MLKMGEIQIKTDSDIKAMVEGGKKLSIVKKALKNEIKKGVDAMQIENLAVKLIEKEGGKASFKMVEGYKYATCVNLNDGVVHGIPKKEIIFRDGDVVSVDVGFYYKGFHTDTSFSVLVGQDKGKMHFLEVGKNALRKAINQAKPGRYVFDISKAIENTLKSANLTPVKSLVGHGVGRNLHEEPQIPCFTYGSRQNTPKLANGMVIAIEVMYVMGNADLVIDTDGWTIATRDGKIAGLFEETVAVTKNGPLVIT
jgi:methionyl aminopeptidase